MRLAWVWARNVVYHSQRSCSSEPFDYCSVVPIRHYQVRALLCAPPGMADIDHNPHKASILPIIVFGFLMGPLSFCLRLWARATSAIAFWWDDLLMGAALVRLFDNLS